MSLYFEQRPNIPAAKDTKEKLKLRERVQKHATLPLKILCQNFLTFQDPYLYLENVVKKAKALQK